MLIPVILLATAALQLDEVDLITDGNFEKPLPPLWTSTNLRLTLAAPPKKKSVGNSLKLESGSGGGQLRVRSNAMVHAGDTLYLLVFARSGDPNGKLTFSVDGSGSVTAVMEKSLATGHEWKEYKFATSSYGYYLPGDLVLTIKLPAAATLELSKLRLLDKGDTPVSSLEQSTDSVPAKTKRKREKTPISYTTPREDWF